MSGILILGYSRIVRKRVLSALLATGHFQRIEIASRSWATGADATAPELPPEVVARYPDYDQALAAGTCDWVYVSLPNGLHARYAAAALEAGKHVIVDKPLTLSIADSRALLAQARRRNLVLAEALTFAHHPQFTLLNRLLNEAGYAGEARRGLHASAVFQFPHLPATDFRVDPRLGGGALWDQGVYAMGSGRALFGAAPTMVSACGWRDEADPNPFTAFSILAEYPGNNVLTGHFGFGFEYKNSLEVAGNGLRVELDRPYSLPQTEAARPRIRRSNMTTDDSLPPADSFAAFLTWVHGAPRSEVWAAVQASIDDMDQLLAALRRV